MNIMFTIPATTISAIVSCRSFVSLTNFRSQDVYVHSTSRHHPSRYRTGGGTGYGSTLGRTDGGVDTTLGPKKSKNVGNTVAGIAFRDGVDPMDQTYSMDELSMDRGHPRRSAKRGYDLGDTDSNGRVLVHIETIVNEHGVVPEGVHPSTMDLEALESLGHGSDKKSFVPDV